MPSSTHPVVQELRTITSSRTLKEPTELFAVIDKANLRYLDSGSSRAVWSLEDGTVLKVALSEESISQNRSEVEAFKCAGPKYLAEVVDHDQAQLWWLVMEKISMDEELLDETIGNWFESGLIPDFDSLIFHLRRKEMQFIYETLQENESLSAAERKKIVDWIKGFVDVVSRCDISTRDIRTANVGIRSKTLLPVVVDYANFELMSEDRVKLSGLLFESWAQHPLLAQVKAAPTYGDLVELTETREFKMAFIGKGRTRWAYDLGDAILKIEMPHSDTQNQSEVQVFECTGPEFFAEIYDYDRENYGWLVMEKLDTSKWNMRNKLESYFGEGSYYVHIDELVGEIRTGLLPAIINRIEEYAEGPNTKKEAIRWVKNFSEVIKRCSVDTFDFHKGNVGIRRSTDQIVFLDYANYDLVNTTGSDAFSLSEILFSS